MAKITQNSLLGKVSKTILNYKMLNPGDRVMVALSGGPDSVCLLELMLKLKEKFSVTILACHYNHNMRGKAALQDQNFVEKLCKDRGVELVLDEYLGKNKIKSEEQAREYRYSFFEKILKEGRAEKIAVAHNLNDSAETLLMRLVRGSGIRGLKSIPPVREKFIRPLLKIRKSEILKFLNEEGLNFCIDQTNLDLTYQRNLFRHKIIPILENINPNLVDTLGDVSEQFRVDYDYMLLNAKKEFKKLVISKENNLLVLNHKEWLKLHPSLKNMVIRLAIEEVANLNNITIKQLNEVTSILNKGVGKKHKPLPHSLRIELASGKIILSKN